MDTTVKLVREEKHEDGSVTGYYEVIEDSTGEVVASFTGRAGPSIAGKHGMLPLGERQWRSTLPDPRMNKKL